MHGVCACACASASASVWISTISHSSCATVRWPNRQYYYHLPLTHETKPNRLVKSEWFCFFNVSIPYLFYVCWIYLFIYIQCSSFSFSFSLERTMRVQNGSNLSIFLYHLFECASHVCCTAICWIYHILVSFIVLNFVIILCGRIIHFYTMGCVWVFMCIYVAKAWAMSIEHWLKRIHIKSTQLQKNTFLNWMRSLSLYLCVPLSLCVCQIYLHIKIYIQYDYSAFLMRTAIHHMCVSVFNLNVYSLGTDTATGITDSFSACGWTFDRVFPFKLHF